MLQLVSHLSSWIKETTWTSLSIPNKTSLPLELTTLLLTLTSCMLTFRAYQACSISIPGLRENLAPEFTIGSHVFIRAQFFCTTQPSKKLAEKYLGPFKVIAWASSRSHTLQLLDSMCVVNPVFHVSMLEPVTPNSILNWVQVPLLPVDIDGEPEYKISEILDSKTNQCRRPCNLLYLIWWSGYEGTDEETSWILVTKLGHTPEIVTEFHIAYLSWYSYLLY